MGEETGQGKLRLKVRFDYRGTVKPGRFLFGTKSSERVAEELREQQVALLRNVPFQGIQIEDINIDYDLYHIYDEQIGAELAFAPAEVIVRADSLEEILRLILRKEFRKVEILEPEEFSLNRYELERLLFRLNNEIQNLFHLQQRRK